MASLSELVDYARAKQPRNGLAEMASHFLVGADAGYDAGQKAKNEKYEQILKSAQALKANEEARGLKIQNDVYQSFMNQAKMTGQMPLTAGETLNGKTTIQNDMGDPTAPVTGIARLAKMFAPDGMVAKSTNIKLPGKMGSVSYSTPGVPKSTTSRSLRPDNPLNQEREDRIVWDKATARALKMAQNENPMATFEDSKKYLPTAFESLGKDPADYLKDSPLVAPPVNNDPWGLLKSASAAGAAGQ